MNKLIFELKTFKRFLSCLINEIESGANVTNSLKDYLTEIIHRQLDYEKFKKGDLVYYFFFHWNKDGYIELRKGIIDEIDYNLGLTGCARIQCEEYGFVTDIDPERLFLTPEEAREKMAELIQKSPVIE